MTRVEQLAGFVAGASFEDLSGGAREELKIRVLDSLGCALGALDAPPMRLVGDQVAEFAGDACTLVGGGRAAPDHAAFGNGALVRYLDFNDSYLAEGESCHPSDNLAPVLAAAEYAGGTRRDLMVALAVAYQVQCRLSDEAPVRAKGFDHTTQGAYAAAAGASRALRLDRTATSNAIAISGTAFNALRVTRTGALSHWKGLAYPATAAGAVWVTCLARRGITGPLEVFEGNKGFMETIAGQFAIDWSREDLERVTRTILKKHNAEVHSQTAIEAALALGREHRFTAADIERIDVEVFDVAYKIIGGGEEGDKSIVRTKEEADHSLPYLVAVALLDGRVMPAQFASERIGREDVQQLLRKVVVRENRAYSERFPREMPCRVTVRLRDRRVLANEIGDYRGLDGPAFTWAEVLRKFEQLSEPVADGRSRQAIVDAVANLETIRVADLTRLLGGFGRPPGQSEPIAAGLQER